MAEALRLLVVDDAPEHARMVEDFIRRGDEFPDAHIRIATSYEQALAAFAEERFDVALFDYWLGSRDGVSLLREVRQKGVDAPLGVLTSPGAGDGPGGAGQPRRRGRRGRGDEGGGRRLSRQGEPDRRGARTCDSPRPRAARRGAS